MKATYKSGVETKNKIISTARKMFSDKGIQDVTIAQICSEAGIAPGNFTYYFPSKASLIKEIFRCFQAECETFAKEKLPDDIPLAFLKCL